MHTQEPVSSQYAPEPPIPTGSAPGVVAKLGWSLLGSTLGRSLALAVCRFMGRGLERRRGAPVLESRNRVVRLWRVEQFRQVSWATERLWVLRDGVRLTPDDPVLEFHIAGDRFMELVQRAPWRNVIAQEFRSLVPLLQTRTEVALVGSTILRRQVADFGASVRELPPGCHRSFDTFYRRLILLVFHPGGAKRVLTEREPVAEAAISRQEFCRRYQGRGGNA